MIDFVLKSFQLNKNCLPPVEQYIISQIHIFKLIFLSDFESARHLLRCTVGAMDLYQLCACFAMGPVMEHSLHFVAAALIFLGMAPEYSLFRERVAHAFQVSGQEHSWPEDIAAVASNMTVFSHICENPCCRMMYWKLHSFYAAEIIGSPPFGRKM